VINSIRDSASVQVVLLLVVSAALVALAVFIIYRIRRNPRDKEKRRRMAVNLRGRLSEAIITEVQDNTVYYSYSISGVVYTASQDISQLRELIQTDPERLIGNVSLKYQPRNPANSIILCEDWSGLRVSRI
jgi:hypothetical protein